MNLFANDAGSRVAEVVGTLMQNVPFQAAGRGHPFLGFRNHSPVPSVGERLCRRLIGLNRLNGLIEVIVGVVLVSAAIPLRAAEAEGGVALAIVYDTSGSMKDNVKDEQGKASPKYV